jgi:hypothetical protein
MNKKSYRGWSPGFVGIVYGLLIAVLFGSYLTGHLQLAALAGTPFLLGTVDLAGIQSEMKTGIGEIKTGIEGLKSEYKTLSDANNALRKEFDDAKGHLDTMRKSNLRWCKISRNVSRRNGEVSEDCARFIGGLVVMGADAHGRLNVENSIKEKLLSEARGALGITGKAALTSADIPLPVEYSGDVIELVTLWGKARQNVTMYPLGTGQVKLPKLTTSPAFGFIAQSAPFLKNHRRSGS